MLTDVQRHEIAEGLLAAERTHDYIPPLTVTHPEADLDDAYRIAMEVTAAKVAAGREVRGHKIGYTSKAMRSLTGALEPDYGTLFDDWFVPEGSVVPMGRFNRPLVEVELAFVLGEGIDRQSVNAADVIRATDFVLPAIEIVDSRYNARAPGGSVVNSVADAASCGLVVLGATARRLTDGIDLRRIGASLARNGVIEESGVASAVMGNPINAVAWLANKLRQFGVPMEAGHVILSGSFVKALPCAEGDTISAVFDEFGEVGFAIGGAEEGGA